MWKESEIIKDGFSKEGKHLYLGSTVLSVLKPAQKFRMAKLRHEQKPVHNDY